MNWKTQVKDAAAQEGVDYAAVAKAFMDQAYGFVASKAKVLFADPHRLGFEVVRRNERATRMVGIFTFRVDQSLLYAPVFFVNGEIRPVDMIYRADVKRFVSLTEDWCAFLVEGMNQEAGSSLPKGRRRQTDGHLDRLAYPQLRKYASNEDGAVDAWEEMLKLAASTYDEDAAVPLLLPKLAAELGAPIIEKIASIEATPAVTRLLSEFYDLAALVACDVQKSASDESVGSLVLVNDHLIAKDAAEASKMVFDGYSLRDTRPEDSKAVVVDYSEDVNTLSAPGVYRALLVDGATAEVLVLRDGRGHAFAPSDDPYMSEFDENCRVPRTSEEMVLLHGGQITRFRSSAGKFFGTLLPTAKVPELLAFSELQPGKSYERVDTARMVDMGICTVESKSEKGLTLTMPWEEKSVDVFYVEDQAETVSGRTFNKNLRFYEVKQEPLEGDDRYGCRDRVQRVELPLMSRAGVSDWVRTAGGSANSTVITVESRSKGMYDLRFDNKLAGRDMSKKAAHIMLALRGNIDADEAERILESRRKVVAYERVKKAYTTRVDPEMNWEEHTDPVFGNTVTYPQTQVLATTTPERFFDEAREGDRFEATPRSGLQHSLPEEMIMSASPEHLAQMAQTMQLPHIFDHGVVGQLSASVFDAVSQVGEYIADMEQGMDRVFRVLFLVRYRPAEFEDAFGTDTLMETEQEFSELGRMMGEVLLKMIRRHRASSSRH